MSEEKETKTTEQRSKGTSSFHSSCTLGVRCGSKADESLWDLNYVLLEHTHELPRRDYIQLIEFTAFLNVALENVLRMGTKMEESPAKRSQIRSFREVG